MEHSSSPERQPQFSPWQSPLHNTNSLFYINCLPLLDHGRGSIDFAVKLFNYHNLMVEVLPTSCRCRYDSSRL